MSLSTFVQTLLEGIGSGVDDSNIRLFGQWQNLGEKYILHGRIFQQGKTLQTGALSGLKDGEYQVSVFAPKYSDAESIAEAVRDRLQGLQVIGSPPTDGVNFLWLQTVHVGRDFEVNREHFAVRFQALAAI